LKRIVLTPSPTLACYLLAITSHHSSLALPALLCSILLSPLLPSPFQDGKYRTLLSSVINTAHPVCFEGERKLSSPSYMISSPLPPPAHHKSQLHPQRTNHTFKYKSPRRHISANMAKSSFANIFNRLPIYSRPPKEPCIGDPVLTHTSNEQLSGKVPASVFGPQRFDSRLGNLPTGHIPKERARGLPSIPT